MNKSSWADPPHATVYELWPAVSIMLLHTILRHSSFRISASGQLSCQVGVVNQSGVHSLAVLELCPSVKFAQQHDEGEGGFGVT